MASTKAHVDFNPAKAEAFAGRFLTALNHGALCLMVSIGHRTGLLDVLRELPPSTPKEIAARAGLHERYVREWLGAMATSGVVEIDPAGERFVLPVGHAAWLTRAAAADNMAVFAQYHAALGGVEDDIRNNLAHPLDTFLYTVSCMHCMAVSLAQGGESLGAMWGEEKTREYLQNSGFRSIETHRPPHDVQNN